MPSPVLVRTRRRGTYPANGARPSCLPPPLHWRGATFLLSGGSLPLGSDEQRRRWRGLGVGLGLQIAFTAAILAWLRFGSIPVILPLHSGPPEAHWLVAPPLLAPPLTPPRKPARLYRRLQPTSVPPLLPPPRRLQPQRTRVHPAPAVTLSNAAPLIAAAALPPPPPPTVHLGKFGNVHGIPLQKGQPVPAPVLGRFGRANAASDPPDPPSASKTGLAGFNDPSSANSTGLTAGTAPGSAKVQIGGFGTAGSSASTTSGSDIHLGSFDARPSSAPSHPAPSARLPPAAPQQQPPVVLSWPKPVYTAAAAQHHIEGEVVLRVRLGANGRATVLALVHGLGYGLDQSARTAVQQLHFRPARRDGHAVDWTVLLQVRFQLAN